MGACPTSSCLLVDIVVDCSYVLAVNATPPDVEMARLVALRYCRGSASVRAACVTEQAVVTACAL